MMPPHRMTFADHPASDSCSTPMSNYTFTFTPMFTEGLIPGQVSTPSSNPSLNAFSSTQHRHNPLRNTRKRVISKTAIKLFFMWLFSSFLSLIQPLLPYLEGQLIFIHDMASISTYFYLLSDFFLQKVMEKRQKSKCLGS